MDKFKDPSTELINNVHGYLEQLAFILIGKIFARFPGVIDDITDITSSLLREEKDKTKQLVDEIIESEQNYIFTNDLNYLVSNSSFIPVVDRTNQQDKTTPIDPQKIFVGELRSRIDSYVNIVLRNIRDLIPKLIGNFLVAAAQSRLQYTIYNDINRKEELMNALGEPPHITAERETLTKVLGILNKAKKVLQKDPDLATPLRQEESVNEDSLHADVDANKTRATNPTTVKSQNVTNSFSNPSQFTGNSNAYTAKPDPKEKSKSPERGINIGNGLVLDNVGFSPLTGLTGNVKPQNSPFGNNVSVGVGVNVDKNMNLVSNANVGNPLVNGGQKPVAGVNPLAQPTGTTGTTTKPAGSDTSLFGAMINRPQKK